MQITIHRGNQIGGCITEIATDTTRIFIDMGDNLPGNGERMTDEQRREFVERLFTQNSRPREAVFYTHAHADHTGMMQFVPQRVKQYMSRGTRRLLMIKEDVLIKRDELAAGGNALPLTTERKECLKRCRVWDRPLPRHAPQPITVGDISVTPFFVSHSTHDAHMLLIEDGRERILHTGDYRGHGYLSKGLFPTLRHYIGQVDTLITEGTMLGRDDACITERTVSNRMLAAMKAHKYVFVLVSATDIERLAAINSAAQRARRPLYACSLMMYRSLAYFNRSVGNLADGLFRFRYRRFSPTVEREETVERMRRDGFVMLVGANHAERTRQIMRRFDPAQTLLIYSTWDGYYKIPEQVEANSAYSDLRRMFPKVLDIHTSGHADKATIAKLILAVNPREAVIGIHKDPSTSLTQLDLPEEIKEKIVEL